MPGGSPESKQKWSFKRQLSRKGWSGPGLEVEALRLLGLWRANLPYCVQPKVHHRIGKKTSPAILRPAVQAASVSSCPASPLSDNDSSVDALVTSSTSAGGTVEKVAAAEAAVTLEEYRRLLALGGISKHLRGINIQWPWARLILDGLKTVEARTYKLTGYLNEDLWII